jgi:hypothetical protein
VVFGKGLVVPYEHFAVFSAVMLFFFQVDAVRFPTNIPIPPNAEAQASDVGLEDAEAEVWRSRKLFSARCMYAGVVLVRN